MAFFFLSVLYVLCGSSPRRHEANPAMDWRNKLPHFIWVHTPELSGGAPVAEPRTTLPL